MIADLCTPVVPVAPDAAEAAEYARTGDDAQAAGDLRIAIVAYRKAAELGDAHAATTMRELCEREAEPTLEEAIALFKRGELARAQAILATLDTPGSHFFRAAIALRHHDGAVAVHELLIARRDPEYAAASTTMLRVARRTGRVEALGFLGGEIDTNPHLLPDTPPTGAIQSPATDGDGQVGMTINVHPTDWLFVRDVFVWRQQAQQSELDFVGNVASLGVEDNRGRGHALIRYDFDDDVLGGDEYLLGHRATLGYRRDFSSWDLGVQYALHERDFRRATEEAFDGDVHTGELAMTAHASPTLDIDLKLVGWRELTRDALFTDWSAGAQAGVRSRPVDRLRLGASAETWISAYDGLDPNGLPRRDYHGEMNADLEIDVSDHVLAIAAVTAIVNRSTLVDFDYWKLVARVGLAFAIGGP